MAGPFALRAARALVATAAILVPGRDRRRWQREWDAELVCWWQRGGSRRHRGWTALRRAALSPLDALAFRRRLCFRYAGEPLPRQPRPEESPMGSLLQDLRFAWRACRRQPALIAILLTTMAIGIGGNTAIFSLLHGIVLSPLPYDQPEQIVQVWPARSRGLSKELYLRLREEATSFAWLAGWNEDLYKLRSDDRAELVYGPRVTADVFRVLGARPAIGRLFVAGDDRRAVRPVVLSYAFWQRRYGGDPGVLGRTLTLSDRDYVVVGVTEPGFELVEMRFDLAVTHVVESDQLDHSANYLDLIARLAPGVTVAQADAELKALTLRIAEEEGISPAWAESASVVSLHDFVAGDVRPTLYLLFGAVGFLLLIVVANVANLLLARALSRDQEIAVRLALGASRLRLVRQLLTETTVLALAGGALGVGLARLLLNGLIAVLPADIPRLASIRLAPEVLAFSVALAVATGLVVGLVPALSASRTNLGGSLGSAGRRVTGSRARRHVRGALVVAEVTLAAVLLAGAGVLIKSFWRTLQVDPGFEPAGLVQFRVLPGPSSWSSPEALEDYYRQLRERLRTVPGVEAVATVHAVPIANGGWVMGTYPVDDPPAEGDLPPFARWRPVSPEYFPTAGLRMIAGRAFTDRDTADSEPVVILNRTTARTFFGDGQAVGQQVRISFEKESALRVVGVVDDVKILGLRQAAPLAAYRPFPQSSNVLQPHGIDSRSMVVRSALPAAQLEAALRAAVAEHDRFASVLHLDSMAQVIAVSLAQPRAVMLLLAAFAAIALLLGAIGLYGVMGYAVGERTREMGIRLVLGASAWSILRAVMASGLRLTGLGLLLGAGLSLALTRLLSSQLFEVGAGDPLTLAAAAAVLLAAALLATYLPARRAGRLDAAEVLRAD